MNKLIETIKRTNKEQSYKQNGLHTFINPFSYLKIRNRGILENFDFIYVDGFLLVSILGLLGVKVSRKSFDMTSLAKKVFIDSVEKNKSVYFIGSTKEAIGSFIHIVRRNFPKMNIVGNRNGYFENEKERKNTIKTIITLNPDILVVGMGTPFQEIFLLDLYKAGWVGCGYTCGGFIHQTTSGIEYYPSFFNKYNLRWLYRIYDEPKLVKRYLFFYPLSLLLIIFDFFKCKTKLVFRRI
ncbi:WecB/TagA/CpsF family glycosyltransferase [Maribacter sp. PR1]|uniref:WecB/TagA/CpsF family glycosyltransferase n=1 Tax=Maribacter cobaltidurans TaxID=1178778 RepID=A0ABU7IQM3_9FLAO|nr:MULTISPECIES: WecB/TagA/CpsF family glycosyltransferase [Maribacter]MDC6387790.1 WecB/TagA/CpsF family glycosyltransferase [Maribacter sp. PR1]MEE1975179.1 WecB/TagA/CpsF family glycosyltransferase [Maribacter cobaltidurans]